MKKKLFFDKLILKFEIFESEMHLMIHRGDKPHKCDWPGCEKRFVEKGNMRKHYNSVHAKM